MDDLIKKEEGKKRKNFFVQHPLITTGIMCLVIFAGGFFGYVSPALKVAKNLELKDADALELKIDQRQAQLLRIKRLAKKQENIPPETKQLLLESLPTGDAHGVDAMTHLATLAKTSGLTVTEIEFRTTKKIPAKGSNSGEETKKKKQSFTVKETGVKLGVEGLTYATLKRFIQNLEVSARLVRLDGMGFSPDEDTAKFNLTIFHLE